MALSGRYQIHKLLKDGLYGPILQCQDMLAGHQMVAVKVVSLLQRHQIPNPSPRRTKTTDNNQKHQHNINTTSNQAAQERQIIEMLQATNGHPNVLQFHHIYEEEQGTVQVIVMEFCGGGDLQEQMERQPCRRFEEPTALEFFAQVVSGVQFLHANGIAHRDLSLENVLVTDQNVCKICDFGLSVHSTTMSNEIVGKRFYMAPEVIFGGVYDPQLADLWSLGIMLFIMLTGLPLVDFHATRDSMAPALARQQEDKCCASALNRQGQVNDVTLEIIKLHGVSKLLELWGLEWMVSFKTMKLLDGILQVLPRARLRPEAILQRLRGDDDDDKAEQLIEQCSGAKCS